MRGVLRRRWQGAGAMSSKLNMRPADLTRLAKKDNGAQGAQNQPRPPPGELMEAALEHFIEPGFATKCGSS